LVFPRPGADYVAPGKKTPIECVSQRPAVRHLSYWPIFLQHLSFLSPSRRPQRKFNQIVPNAFILHIRILRTLAPQMRDHASRDMSENIWSRRNLVGKKELK
jgi:hypothetical protein